jgi:hypothetical protein
MPMGRVKKVGDVKRTIAGAEAEADPSWDGPTWECAVASGGFTGNALQDRLNQLGAQGWEPYAAVSIGAAVAQVFLRRQTR